MSTRLWSRFGVAVICVALPLSANARPDRSDVKTAAARNAPGTARPVGPTSTAGAAATVTRATSILGAAWTADNTPIKQAKLRLRNVISGKVEATTVANEAGQFAFDNVEGGSYMVELVNDASKIQALGHVFTIAPGETVATFVRLGTKVPWFTGFFGNTMSAVTSSAASEGVMAITPLTRPVSANQ